MLWDEPKIFFLERRYFFSIILSEFLKNRVALQKDTRSVIPSDEKKRFLERQDNRCAKCGKTITLSSMHVDHIVPWDYVGDELEHNRQGLCSVCNSRKSNHVAMAVSDLILNRRK